MCFIVSGIVGGVDEQNSILNNVCADDWTAERAIIASNNLVTFLPKTAWERKNLDQGLGAHDPRPLDLHWEKLQSFQFPSGARDLPSVSQTVDLV